jgi:hypothetical protein
VPRTQNYSKRVDESSRRVELANTESPAERQGSWLFIKINKNKKKQLEDYQAASLRYLEKYVKLGV